MHKFIMSAMLTFTAIVLPHIPLAKHAAQLNLCAKAPTSCLAPRMQASRQNNTQQLLANFLEKLKKTGIVAKSKTINDMPLGELTAWLELFAYLQVVCNNDEVLMHQLLEKAMMGRVAILEQAPPTGSNMPKRLIPFTPANTASLPGPLQMLYTNKFPTKALPLFDPTQDFESIAVVADSVFSDGMGDIAHVVEMSKALMARYPQKTIKIYLPAPAKNTGNDMLNKIWQDKYIAFIKNSGLASNIVWLPNTQYRNTLLFADAASLKKADISQDIVLQLPCPPLVLGLQYYPPKAKIILSLSEYYGSSELVYNKRATSLDMEEVKFAIRYTSGIYPNMGLLFPETIMKKAQELKRTIQKNGKTASRLTLLNSLHKLSLLENIAADFEHLLHGKQLSQAIQAHLTALIMEEHKTGQNDLLKNFAKNCLNPSWANSFIKSTKTPGIVFNTAKYRTALQTAAQRLIPQLEQNPDFSKTAATDWFFAYSTYAASTEIAVEKKYKSKHKTPVTLFNFSSDFPTQLLDIGNAVALGDHYIPKSNLDIIQMQHTPKELFVELMFLSDDILTTGDHSTVEALIASAVFGDKILNFETRAHKATFVSELLINLKIQLTLERTRERANVYTFDYDHNTPDKQHIARKHMSLSCQNLMRQSNLFESLEKIINLEWRQVNRINNLLKADQILSSCA